MSTTEISDAFLAQSRRLLIESYLPRIEQAIEGLSDEQIVWRANAGSNSIANLVLHLSGNVRQWIISGLGGAADDRNRQSEFEAQERRTGQELSLLLRSTVEEADRVLATVTPAMLLEGRRIQSYDVTVLHAIYAVVEHFSMHTGQIILLAKMWKGDVAFYELSHGTPHPAWRGGKDGD
jgi:uncharacterized damage-inducible protein DinB